MRLPHLSVKAVGWYSVSGVIYDRLVSVMGVQKKSLSSIQPSYSGTRSGDNLQNRFKSSSKSEVHDILYLGCY